MNKLVCLVALLVVASTPMPAKTHDFHDGKLIAVGSDDRIVDGTSEGHAILAVQLADVIYTVRGDRIRRGTKDFAHGLIIGDAVKVSVEGKDLFLLEPGGKNFKTGILKRERVGTPQVSH
jgi:hypothetical protein